MRRSYAQRIVCPYQQREEPPDDRALSSRRSDFDDARHPSSRGDQLEPRAHRAHDQGGLVAVEHGPAGEVDLRPRGRPSGVHRRGARPRPRLVLTRVRDRHPGTRDRRARAAGQAVERLRDRPGQGAPSGVPRPLLQRRLRDRARGRIGRPQAPQGRAAAARRALGHAPQRLGSLDRALRLRPRRVLPGRRHRDRADRDHDGQRGVVSRERPRAGDERLRDRLPRAVSRARA